MTDEDVRRFMDPLGCATSLRHQKSFYKYETTSWFGVKPTVAHKGVTSQHGLTLTKFVCWPLKWCPVSALNKS